MSREEFIGGIPSSEDARCLLDKARKHNSTLSKIDHGAGFAAPEDGPTDAFMRTVMSALSCAMDTQDWGIVAEALSMLLDYEKQIRGKYNTT